MANHIDRREFLKIGAAGTLGARALSGGMGLAAVAAGKPVRLGLIGVGNRGTSHLETLLAMGAWKSPPCATSTRSTWRAPSRWWRRPGRNGRKGTGATWRITSG